MFTAETIKRTLSLKGAWAMRNHKEGAPYHDQQYDKICDRSIPENAPSASSNGPNSRS